MTCPLLGLAFMPWPDLPRSFRVDALGLAAAKPAARTRRPSTTVGLKKLSRAAVASGFVTAADACFVVLARTPELAQHILAVDASPFPHEEVLGTLLGYPACCARAIAAKGEQSITETLAARTAHPPYPRQLDVSRYLDGISLLSHIPCSPDCTASLHQAEQALAVAGTCVTAARRREPWRQWNRIATNFRAAG
jgi:hypothetical protein